MKNDNKLTLAEQLKAQLNTPQTETRLVVETEDLYPDLEYSDISSSKGYGPCLEGSCRCNKRQLREQIRILENKVPYAPEAASFNLTIRMSQQRTWNFHFKQRGGSTFDVLQMWSIDDARNRLSQLKSQDLWVCNASRIGSSVSSSASYKQAEVVSRLESYISRYNSGQSVSDDITIYN